jgi:outer membrane protein TolC
MVVDLPGALALADRNHPNVLAARARLELVRAQLDEARSAPYSQFKVVGGATVAPALAGNAGYSPNNDVALSSGIGLGFRVGLEGVLPLWTFGKLGHLWEAADANVAVHEAGVEKERDLVRLEVRRAYYGLQLARDAKALLADLHTQLGAAETSLRERVERDEADATDLLKLQTFAAELDVRAAEAERFVDVALAGLRFYTGVPSLDIPDRPLAPPAHALQPIDAYLAAAVKYRPELAQARAGLAARTAQVGMAEANLYPDLGVVLGIGIGLAPEIDDQLNPYANDPANFFRYGAGLAFQWNLDLVPKLARLRQAEAQLAEMRATSGLATGGVAAEVRVAYAEVVDWQRRRDSYAKTVKLAKKWLVRVQSGIDVGTVEDKELVDPAKVWAMGRFNALNATMELDLAMAKLARATGWDAIAPDGESMPVDAAP